MSVIILFIFNLLIFNYWNIESIKNIENEFLVIENKENYVILENDNNKFLFYDDNVLSLGNKIKIKGNVIKLSKDSEFNMYLHSQKVFYLLDGEVTYNDYNISFVTRIIDSLLKNKDERNQSILKLVLFNIKDESNSNFYEYFSEFSINFLIVISGFHINLLLKVLEKRKLLKYSVVTFYLILLNLAVSSLKAFIYYVLKKVNKKLELKLNNMDLLSLLLIALLFVNPSYCFQLGFIYTFVFSYSIELIKNIIDTTKRKGKFLFKILIFMVSLPLILFSNYEINVLSFVFSVLFDIPISILFVFSLLYLFLDKFYLLYKIYILVIEYVLTLASNYSFAIIFGKPSMIIFLLLYLVIFSFLFFYQNKMKKGCILCALCYLFLLVIQFSVPIIDNREMVYFIDVGQGDCIALKIPNSKSVVLIDTGGNKYRDVSNNDIIPFLKSKGISGIDKIIITHDDFDHNGGLDSLINNFNVGDVIDSSLLDVITIGKKQFENLNVSEKRDNDDSIVLYGEWGNIKYLFTGDISEDIEKEIIDKYDLEVDILKVSHHGSITSTCKELLNEIKPKIALIGVGKNNRYKHPSDEVINRLLDCEIKIYRTDLHGNIIIYKSLFTNSIIIEKEKDML